MSQPCGNYARHWFTVPGAVSLYRPDCARCGAPRPRPLTADEQREFDYAVEKGWARPARSVSNA